MKNTFLKFATSCGNVYRAFFSNCCFELNESLSQLCVTHKGEPYFYSIDENGEAQFENSTTNEEPPVTEEDFQIIKKAVNETSA